MMSPIGPAIPMPHVADSAPWSPDIAADAAAGPRSSRFAGMLSAGGADAAGRGKDELREAAEGLIAHALVLPVLKMVRSGPFRTELFHGGAGERAFGAQLDQRLADLITDRLSPALVQSVYERIDSLRPHSRQVDRHG